jgi:hypothetical protein
MLPVQAFQLSTEFMVCEMVPTANQQVPGKHQQLVVSALRLLGPVLASEGYELWLATSFVRCSRHHHAQRFMSSCTTPSTYITPIYAT